MMPDHFATCVRCCVQLYHNPARLNYLLRARLAPHALPIDIEDETENFHAAAVVHFLLLQRRATQEHSHQPSKDLISMVHCLRPLRSEEVVYVSKNRKPQDDPSNLQDQLSHTVPCMDRAGGTCGDCLYKKLLHTQNASPRTERHGNMLGSYHGAIMPERHPRSPPEQAKVSSFIY